MKKQRIQTVVTTLVMAAFFIGVLFWMNTPEKKAARFVYENGKTLSDLLDQERPIPAELSGKYYNAWDGEHPMDEFILDTRGNTYYGCYYSPDDVPLAFQNAQIPLTEDGQGRWRWEGEGDNHGVTQKLADCWYYFEASL